MEKDQFIGLRKIKCVEDNENLITVFYEDGKSEVLSKVMFDVIVSNEACDASKLRDKRCTVIAEQVLMVMRNYGLKINEFPYLSALISTSFEENEKAALAQLWKKWNQTINHCDDVDLITMDRILKEMSNEAQLSPYGTK